MRVARNFLSVRLFVAPSDEGSSVCTRIYITSIPYMHSGVIMRAEMLLSNSKKRRTGTVQGVEVRPGRRHRRRPCVSFLVLCIVAMTIIMVAVAETGSGDHGGGGTQRGRWSTVSSSGDRGTRPSGTTWGNRPAWTGCVRLACWLTD